MKGILPSLQKFTIAMVKGDRALLGLWPLRNLMYLILNRRKPAKDVEKRLDITLSLTM